MYLQSRERASGAGVDEDGRTWEQYGQGTHARYSRRLQKTCAGGRRWRLDPPPYRGYRLVLPRCTTVSAQLRVWLKMSTLTSIIVRHVASKSDTWGRCCHGPRRLTLGRLVHVLRRPIGFSVYLTSASYRCCIMDVCMRLHSRRVAPEPRAKVLWRR